MPVQVAIIGLDQIGTSIGLALLSHKDQFFRLGNDRSNLAATQAKKMGAIDGIEVNFPKLAKKSDIVILSVPADEIGGTIEAIAPDLKDEAVVIDLSLLKSAGSKKISEKIPKGRFLVSLTPSFNAQYLLETAGRIDTASADLFRNGLIVISYPPGTSNGALRLATDLSELLGARVLFADPAEVDGLIAASRLLPQFTAVSLLHATVEQPGWREARKVAGSEYALATAPLLSLTGDQSAGRAVLDNRDNALRVMDDMIASMKALREIIREGDEKALHNHIDEARKARMLWWEQRQQGQWEEDTRLRPALPSAGEAISHMFLGGMGKRTK